jgi:tetratricopeptide (TPR) repeat protein
MTPRAALFAALFALLTSARGSTSPDILHAAAGAFAEGRLGEAETLYSKALQQSSSTSLLISLAAVKTRLGKVDDSTLLLERALASDWKNSQAWLLLGMNSLEKSRDDEALADLMQAVLRDESNPRAHNYLGIAAGRKGLEELSERELRRAAELDPSYADAHFNLAVLYLSRTPPRIEMVRRHYQRALDLGAQRDPALEARLSKAIATPAFPPSSSAALP